MIERGEDESPSDLLPTSLLYPDNDNGQVISDAISPLLLFSSDRKWSNVLQLPMSLNLVSQALICSEAGSGLRFTRENQQTVAFVTPRLS